MAQLSIGRAFRSELDSFGRSHKSVWLLFLFYTLPFSLLPPVMLYYADTNYAGSLLALGQTQLLTVCGVFFVSELVMTFLAAILVQRICEWADTKPSFEDAYKFAVVVPTPLWIAPMFLLIPSFILNLTVGAGALVLSGILIFYCVPSILKIKSESIMLASSAILSVGMVAWAAMLYVALLTWGFVTLRMFA